MLRSIDFIYSKEQAIEKVREILSLNGINDAIEKEINNRYGLKFTFSQGKEFSIILYFKGASSSKIFLKKRQMTLLHGFYHQKIYQMKCLLMSHFITQVYQFMHHLKSRQQKVKRQYVQKF